MGQPIKTTITKDGQRYVDEPIHAHLLPRADVVTPLSVAIARAFGTGFSIPKPIVYVKGYERVQLRWMTADGKGGLKPREGKRG